MHKMKEIFLIKQHRIVAVLFIFFFAISINATQWRNDTLCFGVAENFPPYEYTNAQGESVGSDIDLVRALSQEMRIKYNIKRAHWNELHEMLKRKEIDLLVSAIELSSNDSTFIYSDTYQSFSFVLAVLEKSSIKKMKDVEGKKVVMYNSPINRIFAQKLPVKFKNMYTKTELEALKLMFGDSDIAVFVNGDFLHHEVYKKRIKQKIRIIPTEQPSIPLYIRANKENKQLIEEINKAFYELQINGKYEEINKRWFPKEKSKKWTYSLFAVIFVIIISIIITLSLFIVFRKKTLISNQKRQERIRNIRQLIESFPMPLMLVKLKKGYKNKFTFDDIIFSNKQFYKIFGDVLTEGITSNLILKKSKQNFLSFTKKALQVDENISTIMEFHLKTGLIITTKLHAEVFEIEGQRYLLGLSIDITELLKAREKAHEDNIKKMNFLSNISHEIRTPLTAIVGFSQLLTEIEDPSLRLSYNEIIKTNNKELVTLMNDVLLLSKLEAKSLEINRNEVDLVPFFNEIEKKYKQEIIGNDDLELVVYHPYTSLKVLIDINRLNIVFECLLSNALKYTQRGTIEIGYYVHDDELIYFCQDTGQGIARERQVSIFNRFEKINTFKRGSGLGLTIVRTIMEQGKGKIGVFSEENKGTLMWGSVQSPIQVVFWDKFDNMRLNQILSQRIDGIWFDYTETEKRTYGKRNEKEN